MGLPRRKERCDEKLFESREETFECYGSGASIFGPYGHIDIQEIKNLDIYHK